MLKILLTFLVVGDTHAPRFLERAVSEMVAREVLVGAVLHSGDLTDRSDQMRGALEAVGPLPWEFIPVPGNHDDLVTFQRDFGWTPRAHVLLEEPERVIVVALDSNRRIGGQLEYLSRKVEENEDSRVVVLLHHPPIPCSGSVDSLTSRRWREGLNGILRPEDLVLTGHGHAECHSRLECGTLVLMSSSGCRKRYRCVDPQPERSVCESNPDLSYLRVELLENGEWAWDRIHY